MDDPVTSALTRPGEPLAWAAPRELRRAAHVRSRRRRAIGGATGVVAVAVAAAIVAALTGGGGRAPARTAVTGPVTVRREGIGDGATHLVARVSGPAPAPAAGATVASVAAGETGFAAALTRQLAAADPGSNVVDSPLSASMALAMLDLGARGDTATAVGRALQTAGVSASDVAAAWRVLGPQLLAAGPGVTMQLADSAWLQSGFSFEPTYLAGLGEDFADAAYQADFVHDAAGATAAINAWVARETDGRITRLFASGQLGASTALVLANALHFKAAWADPMRTTTQPFHSASAPSGRVPAITTTSDLRYRVTGQATVVTVPYAGGRFQAVIVEPAAGTMSALLAGLDSTRLAGLVTGLPAGEVDLTMPSLDLRGDQSLVPALSALGMGVAFTSAADLSGISKVPLQVSTVEQADALEVDRAGTDAAAATGAGLRATALRVTPRSVAITIDRPYLYLLRDTRTGTVLVSAVIENPAGS
jgi:serpin B